MPRFLQPCFLHFACWSFLALSFSPPVCPAQSSATGAVTGRIFSPATGKYLRNAEVRVRNSTVVVSSEEGGYYRLDDVRPGTAVVDVTFTGYSQATATVSVVAGQLVAQDFELRSALGSSSADPSVVKLGTFVVSSEREGNAKAIMDQRRSMNVTDSVAADTFGDNAEGNVGDFVKNLPGVELELQEGVARNFRLRGLASEYAGVTLDGITLSSADANLGAAGNARAFSFEQVSLSNLEAVEISKTISADVDANAPAGTVNLRTRRAFDRDGRRVTYGFNLTAMAPKFDLQRTYGPDEEKRHKVLPGGFLEYSDLFFNRRLGVILSVSESNLYSESNRSQTNYNRVPTAADPRPVVVTGIGTNHGPRTNERFTTALTVDFRATPRLTVGTGVIYNYAALNYFQHNATISTGARTTVAGADPLADITATGGNVASGDRVIVKLGQTLTATPKFEYKAGDLNVEGLFAASDSKSWYNPPLYGSVLRATYNTLPGIAFTAKRSAYNLGDWQITQTGGPDWAEGINYKNPGIISNDGRYARSTTFSGALNATLKSRTLWPIIWKAGLKRREESRTFENKLENFNYLYVGPNGGASGSWAEYPSSYPIDLSMVDTHRSSLTGRNVFGANLMALGRLFREHPEYFTQTLTANNYYNANIANKKSYTETIDAAYLMGTTSVGRLRVRAGLRWEETTTDSLEFDPLGSARVLAAGYPVASGRATTIPGLQYQYFSQPRVHRAGGFDNLFPTASAKYDLFANLQAQLGFSHTIRRPTFRDIAGVWTVNDDTHIVDAPNPSLKPELSDNYSARLAYYFEPVGSLSVDLYENRVKGAAIQSLLSAAEFGNLDPDLDQYRFRTSVSNSSEVTIRGLEFSYRQSLTFLPSAFKGVTIYANYSRNYASIAYPSMVPHSAKAGFSYAYRRLRLNAGYTWRDTTRTNTSGTQFQRHRALVDAGGSWRLTDKLSFFCTANNIFNSPEVFMEQIGATPAVTLTYAKYGTLWTVGLKGQF